MAKLTLIKYFDSKQVSFFPIYLLDLSATYSVKKLVGATSGTHINFYHQTNIIACYDEKPWNLVCDITQKKFLNEPDFYLKVKQGMVEHCLKLEKFSNYIKKLKTESLPDNELAELYGQYENKNLALRAYAWIPNFIDMGSLSIFAIAEEQLTKQIGNDEKIKEYVSLLTTPTDMSQQRQHELNLFKIQYLIQRKKIKNWRKDKTISKLINEHLKRYNWLAYYYIGPVWAKKDMVEILENNLRLIKNPLAKIKEIENYKEQVSQEKKKLSARLKLKKSTVILLDKIGTMMFLKIYRKEFLIYSYYCFEPALKEIGGRLMLSLAETRFLTRREIEKYLKNKKLFTEKIRQQIKNRFYKGCVSIISGHKVKIINYQAGKKYLKFIKKEARIDDKIIKGNTAYPGKVTGIAKVINLKQEIGKIKPGEILISRATNPDLIIAMQKAAAFVTDEGGITSHAAIVSREMKKPCLVGTKVASKLIKDGDLIEVDASQGIVNILKKAK